MPLPVAKSAVPTAGATCEEVADVPAGPNPTDLGSVTTAAVVSATVFDTAACTSRAIAAPVEPPPAAEPQAEARNAKTAKSTAAAQPFPEAPRDLNAEHSVKLIGT